MPSPETRILLVTIIVAIACVLGAVSCITYLSDNAPMVSR